MKLAVTKPKILAWGVDPRKQSLLVFTRTNVLELPCDFTRDSTELSTVTAQQDQGDILMPRGREKDRELRRKHRKNQRRMKALEQAQRKAGAKK